MNNNELLEKFTDAIIDKRFEDAVALRHAVLERMNDSRQRKNSVSCQRCGGTRRIRNDGFVWVSCPVCDGESI